MRSRIMFVERKDSLSGGEAHIGRVAFSKTGRTLFYRGKSFRSLNGLGFKANYFDTDTGEYYWISGCKARGCDRLYCERVPIMIDDDVWDEYWTQIRGIENVQVSKHYYVRDKSQLMATSP